MTKITPINYAEAIFAPLFDKNISNKEEFTLIENGIPEGSFQQEWDSCSIQSAAKEFAIQWKGNLPLKDYDTLRFFMNYPPHLHLSGIAVVNGIEHTSFTDIPGSVVPIEPTGRPMKQTDENGVLTEFRLLFRNIGGNPGLQRVTFYWAGLLASARIDQIEEEQPRYTKDSWLEFIDPKGRIGTEHNIFFTNDELSSMKRRIHDPFFQPFVEKLKAEAKKWEDFEPEKEIREYLPAEEHLYRYVRIRDRGRTVLEGPIIVLAIAGYLFDEIRWSKLSARMILSAAHTPKWFEGPQGCMEGSTWHHVCFMEDHHISAIAVALGYLGDILTPAGIDIVLKAIEKAWQQVNHTCEEKGYRWYMNQGLVGNRGRIIGAAILHHYGWGYDTFIEKSYEDHTKILYNYLNEEGHCPEGAYYQYSFSNAVLLWLTYAKYKKTAVRDVVPDRFLQSIQYVESMMSTTEDAGYAMPVNCSRFIPFNMTLLVFLTTVCKWDRGYEYLSHRKYSTDTEDETKLGLDLMILLHWMPTTIQKKKVVEKKLQVFDNGGLLSYRFHENRGGKLWFLCERNPLTGHYHEDRGSVVLEVGGKMLLLDPGTTNYSNMASAYMSRKEYHNVAYPEGVEMYICNEIAEKSAAEAGVGCTTDIGAEDFMDPVPGKITYAQKEDGICFGCDLQPIYRQVFKARRDGILQLHASGGFLTLKDAWKFDESRRLNANFLSYYPWLVEGHKAESNVENIQMTIHFIEENDLPLYLTVDDFMIDSNGRKVYTLRVQSAAAKEVELCSTLHFYTKKALPSIEQPNIFAKK